MSRSKAQRRPKGLNKRITATELHSAGSATVVAGPFFYTYKNVKKRVPPLLEELSLWVCQWNTPA